MSRCAGGAVRYGSGNAEGGGEGTIGNCKDLPRREVGGKQVFQVFIAH